MRSAVPLKLETGTTTGPVRERAEMEREGSGADREEEKEAEGGKAEGRSGC